ncbi:retinol-binding protein pinta-like [Planococcus citri]|uniref:retinol-binding protein pinta-like n=1 Tax=Planococcus citri TaxID=170843 RepID=UPI0031F821F4
MRTKYLEVPDDEQRENARREVNSTAESVKRDVQALAEWLEKQPHLPNFKDEHVLSHCLLNSKNSLEKTKRRLEMYFNTKASLPEIFLNRSPFQKELETQKNIGMFVPLRKLTPDGYRVVMLYLSEEVKTAHHPSLDDFFKLNQMTIELMGKLDYPKGVIVIHDVANIAMPLVVSFSSHLQKLILLTEKAISVRYKKLYFCNMSQAGEILLSIGKSLIKKELANRIEILKNLSDICQYLPKEIIPREYGGEELPLVELRDLWFEEIKNNYEYLQSTEKYVTDLSKAPKDFAATDLSGMVGSFRQISVD